MLRGFAGVVAVTLFGAAGAVVGLSLSGDDRYPDEWASEIRPFAEIVEIERDLEFEHPVYVEFLPPAEFEEQVTSDEDDLSDEDEKEIQQATGLLRAVGLIEGDVDLFAASNSLTAAGVLGFYSYEDERIRIRGEKLTPALKTLLVHELTHALQDQHFDIGDRAEELEDSEDDGAASAFQAVIEGDANRIQTEYIEDLDEDDREAVWDEQQRQSEEYAERVADLPEVLSTFTGAPYALGEAMLQLAATDDGNESVDELFETPPTTEEHLVDPWTLLGDREDAVDVVAPSVEPGAEELDSGNFGALGWLLVLSERIPLLQALDAADGWGGDAYVLFERAGNTCVRVGYQGDTAGDVDEMDAALHRWIGVLPGSAATVEHQEDGGLLFTSCDPGADADVGTDSSRDALDIVLTRTYLAINLMASGADNDQARCLAASLVHHYSTQQLADPELGNDPQIQAEVRELQAACT